MPIDFLIGFSYISDPIGWGQAISGFYIDVSTSNMAHNFTEKAEYRIEKALSSRRSSVANPPHTFFHK